MKRLNFYKISALALLLAWGSGMFTSCTDTEFDAKPIDEKPFEVSEEQMGFVSDENGKTEFSSFELQPGQSGSVTVFLNANKSASTDSEISLVYDEALLSQYNAETGNDFEAMPESNVVLDAGGVLTLKEGTQKSDGIKVNFTAAEDMQPGKVYVIPFRIQLQSGSLKLSERGSRFFIVVKMLEKVGDNNKGENAVTLFSVIETNDTNPLNHLCFTLKNSGKYLFDYVVFFCDNIVYDKETGTVHALYNDNIVKLLNNHEKYLKPLQDRGIKIVLGIMAHHTHASIANLKPEAAQAFARELKSICDTYQLDGIFYDDEYDNPENPTPPGFYPAKSKAAVARLMYEVKQLMPDRVNIAYALGVLESMKTDDFNVDGHGIETYVDFVMADYNAGHNFDFEGRFPGIPQKGWGMHSSEFAKGWWKTEAMFEEIKEKGASHFVFAMDPFRKTFNTPYQNGRPNPAGSTQLNELGKMARIFYGDELVYDEKPYRKDY